MYLVLLSYKKSPVLMHVKTLEKKKKNRTPELQKTKNKAKSLFDVNETNKIKHFIISYLS